MSELDDVLRPIRQELAADYEAKLRDALADRRPEWLVDQLVRLIIERDLAVATGPDATLEPENAGDRSARLSRVRALGIDEAFVRRFAAEHEGGAPNGTLQAGAPQQGTELLRAEHRAPAGEALLGRAKDVLFALLYGDEASGTRLERVQRELLTVALPRHKAHVLDFMRASTELAAAGTWQDPESVSNDERADNVLIEVEFGEVASELVGRGVMVALRLINELEVNEQVLYARMVNVEETSLDDPL